MEFKYTSSADIVNYLKTKYNNSPITFYDRIICTVKETLKNDEHIINWKYYLDFNKGIGFVFILTDYGSIIYFPLHTKFVYDGKFKLNKHIIYTLNESFNILFYYKGDGNPPDYNYADSPVVFTTTGSFVCEYTCSFYHRLAIMMNKIHLNKDMIDTNNDECQKQNEYRQYFIEEHKKLKDYKKRLKEENTKLNTKCIILESTINDLTSKKEIAFQESEMIKYQNLNFQETDIEKAQYGINNMWIDVTGIIKMLISHKQDFRVSNEIFKKDPAGGIVKQLKITLKNNIHPLIEKKWNELKECEIKLKLYEQKLNEDRQSFENDKMKFEQLKAEKEIKKNILNNDFYEFMIVNPNEELVCIYCMDELTETFALVPCGHTNLCTKCYTDQNLKHCPICRKDINMRIKIYK